jgi:hypothetical protein
MIATDRRIASLLAMILLCDSRYSKPCLHVIVSPAKLNTSISDDSHGSPHRLAPRDDNKKQLNLHQPHLRVIANPAQPGVAISVILNPF